MFFQLHFCLRVHYPVVLLSQLCTILAYCPRIQLLYCLCPGYLLPLFRSATGGDTAHREFAQGKASCMHCLCPLTNCSQICSKFYSTLRSIFTHFYLSNLHNLGIKLISRVLAFQNCLQLVCICICSQDISIFVQGGLPVIHVVRKSFVCHRKLLQGLQKHCFLQIHGFSCHVDFLPHNTMFKFSLSKQMEMDICWDGLCQPLPPCNNKVLTV